MRALLAPASNQEGSIERGHRWSTRATIRRSCCFHPTEPRERRDRTLSLLVEAGAKVPSFTLSKLSAPEDAEGLAILRGDRSRRGGG
jgi:hypothetical protein